MKINAFLNKYTGLVLLVVFGALLAVSPAGTKTGDGYSVNDLTEVIYSKSNYVSAEELSNWIIDKKPDFIVIDIREADEYNKYHIPGSENVPLRNLFDEGSMETFDTEMDIILYSNGSTNSSQAWLMLQQMGIDTYILQGGMNYWTGAILNPSPPDDIAADSEILKYQFRKGASGYFTGRTAIAVQASNNEKPKTTTTKKSPRKKKKKKGGSCF